MRLIRTNQSHHMLDKNGYRPNVGIILLNHDKQVFWGKRIREQAWQFPQGGIKAGESPEQAMYRELHEEVGLSAQHVEIIGRTRDWLHYTVPTRWVRREWRGHYRGQKQIWFMLRLLAEDSAISLQAVDHPEFDAWRWSDYWSPLDAVIEFKRTVYLKALTELSVLAGLPPRPAGALFLPDASRAAPARQGSATRTGQGQGSHGNRSAKTNGGGRRDARGAGSRADTSSTGRTTAGTGTPPSGSRPESAGQAGRTPHASGRPPARTGHGKAGGRNAATPAAPRGRSSEQPASDKRNDADGTASPKASDGRRHNAPSGNRSGPKNIPGRPAASPATAGGSREQPHSRPAGGNVDSPDPRPTSLPAPPARPKKTRPPRNPR